MYRFFSGSFLQRTKELINILGRGDRFLLNKNFRFSSPQKAKEGLRGETKEGVKQRFFWLLFSRRRMEKNPVHSPQKNKYVGVFEYEVVEELQVPITILKRKMRRDFDTATQQR